MEIASLILQNVDEKLQKNNDSIGNWVATSENFETNPTYIENIFRDELNKYVNNGHKLNKLMDKAGFFQMQEIEQGNLKPVAVAEYHPDDQTYTQLAPLKWRTSDGKTPFDRILYIDFRDLLLSKAIVGSFVGMGTF